METTGIDTDVGYDMIKYVHRRIELSFDFMYEILRFRSKEMKQEKPTTKAYL
jgi:hypothetical protein